MAKRKRRTTKTSRSHSPAATRRLALGDTVRVKDGVMNPNDDGYCIGGWSGEIIALDTWEQMPMALIEWDASTQRDRIDPEVRRRAASQGLSAYSQNIRTRLPAGGYAPPIAHTSACLLPSDPGYSPAR